MRHMLILLHVVLIAVIATLPFSADAGSRGNCYRTEADTIYMIVLDLERAGGKDEPRCWSTMYIDDGELSKWDTASEVARRLTEDGCEPCTRLD